MRGNASSTRLHWQTPTQSTLHADIIAAEAGSTIVPNSERALPSKINPALVIPQIYGEVCSYDHRLFPRPARTNSTTMNIADDNAFRFYTEGPLTIESIAHDYYSSSLSEVILEVENRSRHDSLTNLNHRLAGLEMNLARYYHAKLLGLDRTHHEEKVRERKKRRLALWAFSRAVNGMAVIALNRIRMEEKRHYKIETRRLNKVRKRVRAIGRMLCRSERSRWPAHRRRAHRWLALEHMARMEIIQKEERRQRQRDRQEDMALGCVEWENSEENETQSESEEDDDDRDEDEKETETDEEVEDMSSADEDEGEESIAASSNASTPFNTDTDADTNANINDNSHEENTHRDIHLTAFRIAWNHAVGTSCAYQAEQDAERDRHFEREHEREAMRLAGIDMDTQDSDSVVAQQEQQDEGGGGRNADGNADENEDGNEDAIHEFDDVDLLLYSLDTMLQR